MGKSIEQIADDAWNNTELTIITLELNELEEQVIEGFVDTFFEYIENDETGNVFYDSLKNDKFTMDVIMSLKKKLEKTNLEIIDAILK